VVDRYEVVFSMQNHIFLGTVLVLTGIELIFYIVAFMGLCFGFVLKTMLIMQRGFCCC